MQVGALSDNADFRRIRSRASVRTTRHANAERFVVQAGCVPDLLNLAGELRPYALAFGDCLAASWQGWAGHRLTQHRSQIGGRDDAVRTQQPLNYNELFHWDPGQQEVLLGRESHVGLQAFDHLAQSGANPLLSAILDPPAQYSHAVKPSSVALRMPTQVILGAMPRQGARRLQCLSQSALQLLSEPLYAPGLDDVLQPGQAAV